MTEYVYLVRTNHYLSRNGILSAETDEARAIDLYAWYVGKFDEYKTEPQFYVSLERVAVNVRRAEEQVSSTDGAKWVGSRWVVFGEPWDRKDYYHAETKTWI